MNDKIIVDIRNLSMSYWEAGERHVIFENVSHVIRQGEFVVLLGRSGSGKSTLLNLISGIDRPDHGEIRVDGINLTGLSEKDRTLFRRRHIGFVFQSFNLLPTLTVEENLLLPLELNGRGNGQARVRAQALLAELGLPGREDTFPDRLSGGEQQRVAIARALIHEPTLVLADEPTGNLDLDTGREVLDVLERSVRGAGKTMLMVTHSQEIAELADHILTFRHGRLEER
ncbi:MAG: ABC transporter ATP-binding protein [Pseudomonadota bacterium]